MRPSRRAFLSTIAASSALASATRAHPLATKTRNVVVVTLDGFRPEEMFTGAEEKLIAPSAGVSDAAALRKLFWRDAPEERKRALMPFFWDVLAKQGQLRGDFTKGDAALLTNGKKFSYPGYNEMFTGAPDDRIESNDKVPNPNVNVFEWLNSRPGFAGKVAAFGCWDVFPFILNSARAKIPVHAGWEPIPGAETPAKRVLNGLFNELPREWPNSHFDALAFEAALDHLQTERPRVLYIGFGETDEYAHEGRYDRYLDAAHRADRMLGRLWDALNAMPDYRGTTSLVITTDHGRGGLPDGWKNHGANVAGAEKIWVGALGPDTPAGIPSGAKPVTQAQVAATIAALLGEDFCAAFPKAAPPIDGAVSTS